MFIHAVVRKECGVARQSHARGASLALEASTIPIPLFCSRSSRNAYNRPFALFSERSRSSSWYTPVVTKFSRGISVAGIP
jgi:hypothetical protein